MLEKLKHFSLWVKAIGILILVAVFGMVAYYLYDFYSDKLGYTPTKAIDAYFVAFAQGDLNRVYEMTDQADLTDVYGRPVTKSELLRQIRAARGTETMPFTDVHSEKVCDSRGIHYYRVTLTSQVAGTTGTSHLLIQLRRVDKTWLIKYPFAILL
jgi:hypothetical protein